MIPLRLRCEDRARTRRLRHALCVFDVTLRDLSAGGARVVGATASPFSDGAYSIRRARLIWTDGRAAGLEFIA